jgi:hypothetical protein
MLNIKHFSLMTFSTLALISLVGCGGDASCCDGPVKMLGIEENTNTVDIGVKGKVDTLEPTVLVPLGTHTSLPPSATILVNNCDKESIVQGCKALHFEVESNDPDGNNDNLTFAWTIDDILISDKQSFCHKVEGVGIHTVQVVVTDEENTTGSDSVDVIVK